MARIRDRRGCASPGTEPLLPGFSRTDPRDTQRLRGLPGTGFMARSTLFSRLLPTSLAAFWLIAFPLLVRGQEPAASRPGQAPPPESAAARPGIQPGSSSVPDAPAAAGQGRPGVNRGSIFQLADPGQPDALAPGGLLDLHGGHRPGAAAGAAAEAGGPRASSSTGSSSGWPRASSTATGPSSCARRTRAPRRGSSPRSSRPGASPVDDPPDPQLRRGRRAHRAEAEPPRAQRHGDARPAARPARHGRRHHPVVRRPGRPGRAPRGARPWPRASAWRWWPRPSAW